MDTIGTVHMLWTNQLIPNPDNPRKDIGDIQETAEKIMEIYKLLQEYGYEMKPEEKALLDGTHELYVREKS